MKNEMKFVAAVLCVTVCLLSCKKELNPNEPGLLVPLTVDLDASLPSISVNGTQLHSESFGDPADPMVIFLHGGPGADYRNGMNVKNLVSDHYYVVFYDQRGSGLSKRHPENSYNIDVMIDDLSAVIQHYRNSSSQKIFLFGHSWGAMLATAYVNKYPDAIAGIILAEPGGLTNSQREKYTERSRHLKLFNEVTNDALFPDQFLTGNENDNAILDYKLILTASYTHGENNVEGIEGAYPFWRYGAALLKRFTKIANDEGFDLTDNLQKYHTKVLFLYSQNNRAYGESFANELAAAFPNAQVAEVAGTGHEMIWFKWNNVYALVSPYLTSLR